jgi:transcriptional accessory protein Tex/SPT6
MRLEEYARSFVDPEKGVPTVEDALAGARDIVAEKISGDRPRSGRELRRLFKDRAVLASKVASGKEEAGQDLPGLFFLLRPRVYRSLPSVPGGGGERLRAFFASRPCPTGIPRSG